MKATGVVRKLDELGRVVIPIELRRTMGLDTKDDALEFFVENDRIVLKKYRPGCVLCGSNDNIEKLVNGKLICGSCVGQIKA
jgi:transcriptional pleiotropic regulator of transition state genes